MKKLLSILIVALSLITISAKSQNYIDSVSITVGGQSMQSPQKNGILNTYYVIGAPCHSEDSILIKNNR